jgi:hypothetical protein
MSPQDRVRLARLSYLRAVALARADSTASTWQRLLTAAKNVLAAERDRERRLARGAVAGGARVAVSRSTRRIRSEATVHALFWSGPRAATTLDQLREWERSRALVAWSRRLVAEARALRASVVASWAHAVSLARPPVG